MPDPSETSDERIYELFTAARSLEGEERHAFVERIEPGLRDTVASLLAAAGGRRASGDSTPLLEKLRLLPRSTPAGWLPEKIGSYRIHHRLGAGGMGILFLAEDERTGRLVALKVLKTGVLDERSAQRFLVEVDALSRIRHPGVVEVYDSGVHESELGQHPYCAMELVEGVELDEWLARGRDLGERLKLFVQIADAVHHAHQALVLHRDLKPSNVLVDERDRAKVIDFGIAKDLGQSDTPTVTRAGEILGSFATMSPEQAGDPRSVDVRTDVYGLAALLYLMLTGRLPLDFEGCSRAEAIRRIQEEDPPGPRRIDPRIPREVELIVLKGLAKQKAHRYADAQALRNDVRRFLRHEPVEARPPSTAYRLRKWVRRHPTASAVMTTAMVALLVLGTLVAVGLQRRLSEQRLQAALAELLSASLQVGPEQEERDQGLAAFLDASRGDPERRADAASLLRDLAELKFNFSIGLEDRGRTELRQAETLLTRTLQENPDHSDALGWQRRCAIVIVKLGDQDLHDGDWQSGLERYRRAHEVFLELRKSRPESPEAIDDLCWSYQRLAELYVVLGDVEKGQGLREERLAVAEEAVRRFPREPRCLASLCSAYRSLALGRYATRSDDWVRSTLEKAYDVAQRLAEVAPGARRTRAYIVRTAGSLAEDWQLEDGDRSLRFAREAVEAAQSLSRHDADLEVLDLLFHAYETVGEVHAVSGQLGDAEEAYRRALAALDERSRRYPTIWHDHHKRAWLLLNLADVVGSAGRSSEALRWAALGLAEIEEAARSEKATPKDRWVFARALRDAPGGLADPATALQIAKDLVAATEAPAALDLIRLARCRLAAGGPEAALEIVAELQQRALEGEVAPEAVAELRARCEDAMGR